MPSLQLVASPLSVAFWLRLQTPAEDSFFGGSVPLFLAYLLALYFMRFDFPFSKLFSFVRLPGRKEAQCLFLKKPFLCAKGLKEE
jgi:hypothetical protein